MAIVAALIALGLAQPSIALPGQDISASAKAGTVHCKHVKAPQLRRFAFKVWRLIYWQRGRPKATTVEAWRGKLGCAAGPGHRRAGRHAWHERKRAFDRHRSYKLRWGNCSDSGPVPDCIHGAALTYGADEGWMLRVSRCESRWNRFAVNGSSGSTGLFQFIPSTWATTPYGDRDIYSAKWQSLAAAWMYTQGRSGEWVCTG